jgi:hypothetical protein
MENIRGTRRSNMQQLGTTSRGQTDAANSQDDHSNWAMEVYNARKEEELLREAEDGILELDLGEDEAELSQKHLAMAIYYSCKSYNPKVLIAEMLNAWGIQKLVLSEKVGDYLFKLEFSREEEKMKALDGVHGTTRVMLSSWLTMMVSLGRLKSGSQVLRFGSDSMTSLKP